MILKLLVGAAALAALAAVALVLLVRAGLKDPLQDVPVAERAWGKVVYMVRQSHEFEMGRPGRARFFLVAGAAEFVGRCPEAASAKPSYARTSKDGVLRLELLPALSGGRCGRRGFEGSTMPDDPRRLDVELPDLRNGPARVVLVQEGREAVLEAKAEGETVALEAVSDPSGMLAAPRAAYKRLPRTLYLVVGRAAESTSLWGGNIHAETADGRPAPGDALGLPVQYCLAPKPYEYSGGTAVVDGREVSYQSGVSPLGLDELYRTLKEEDAAAGRGSAFTLYALGLDGALARRP